MCKQKHIFKFSIFIFARLMRNKTNMGFLYIWQCSVDLCVLLFFLLLFRSGNTYGISLPSQNDSSCKFLTFLRRFILHASSWMAALITIDRFVFVLFGHNERFKFMKSKLYLTAIILVIFTIIAILDIPNLFFYIKAGACTADFTATISSDIISIFLRTYIPFAIMIMCNLLMIHKIFKNKRAALKVASTSKQSSYSMSRRELQFTLAVIAYDIYFFFFNFPLSIYYIMVDINTYSGVINTDPVFKASYSVASAITASISFCVQAFSIITYIIFNKLFRQEFLYLVGSFFRIQSLIRVHPSQTNTLTHTQIHTAYH